jgi:hypothetical protein
MEPAFHIPLSDDELRLIGEICAIQGQIEYSMHNIVQRLLQTGTSATRKILGSTSIGTNSDVFIHIVRDKCQFPELKGIAEDVHAKIRDLAEGRNDFVHALYAIGKEGDSSFALVSGAGRPHPAFNHTIAIRIRSGKRRAVDAISSVRDTAARISCALAHVDHCLMMCEVGPTAWSGKF